MRTAYDDAVGHARRQLEMAAAGEDPEDTEVQAPFPEYVDDPVGFVEDRIRPSRGVYPYQREFLEAFVDPDVDFPRVAWKANRGAGKTTAVAWLIIWWLCTRPLARVMMIAPTIRTQLREYLIPEVKKWVRRSTARLPLEVLRDSIRHRDYGDEWKAIGVQSEKTEKIEGMHEKHVLVVIEEAKGVPKDAIESAAGTQTDPEGDNAVAMISIPGRPTGAFHAAFAEDRDLWTHHVSASAFDAIEAGALRASWEEERRQAWGETSPRYKREVLAEFAEDSTEAAWDREDIAGGRIVPPEGVHGPTKTLRWLEKQGVSLETAGLGVDPSGGAAEVGIVGAGRGSCPFCDVDEEHGFVLVDESAHFEKSNEWGREVVDLFHAWGLDVVYGERNYGGDMVRNTIKTVREGEHVAFEECWASRGKSVRAEPIASLYTEGKVHHVGRFPELEDEMCSFDDEADWSPNRMDALVWVLAKLFALEIKEAAEEEEKEVLWI